MAERRHGGVDAVDRYMRRRSVHRLAYDGPLIRPAVDGDVGGYSTRGACPRVAKQDKAHHAEDDHNGSRDSNALT
jgi:hypothetical protein